MPHTLAKTGANGIQRPCAMYLSCDIMQLCTLYSPPHASMHYTARGTVAGYQSYLQKITTARDG